MRYVKNLFLCLFVIVLISCNLPTRTVRNLTTEVVMPVNNYLMSVGQSARLMAFIHSEPLNSPAFTASTISQVVFYANGIEVSRDRAPQFFDEGWLREVVGRGTFLPTAPGEYLIQAEGYLNDPGGDAGPISPAIRICVLDGGTWLPSGEGYEGPCEMPTRRADAPAEGELQMLASVEEDPIYYWLESCGVPQFPTRVVFRSELRDTADFVLFVNVRYEYEHNDGRVDALRPETVFLNYRGAGSTLEKLYVGATSDIGGILADLFGAEGGWIRGEHDGISTEGRIVTDASITRALPCGPAPKPDEEVTETPDNSSSAEATTPPSVPMGFTLTSNAICRKGPNNQFEIAEYINNGDTVQAYARSANSEWVRVILANKVNCWVAVRLGALSGDISQLPIEDIQFIPPNPAPSDDSKNNDDKNTVLDNDGDGYNSDNDCDDNNPQVNPGIDEYPGDGYDSNCNGDDNT